MWEIVIKVAVSFLILLIPATIKLAMVVSDLISRIKSLEKNNEGQDMDIKATDGLYNELKTEVKLISQNQQIMFDHHKEMLGQVTELLSKQDVRISKLEESLVGIREDLALQRQFCRHQHNIGS